MYIPSSFSETDLQVLTGLIDKHPLGLFITNSAVGLLATPIPFKYRHDYRHDDKPKLVAHLARANPHWKELVDLNECLVVFQGAESYITPTWYPSKEATHKVVPTWNYEMVQVRGKPKVIESAEWLKAQVAELTNLMEQKRAESWDIADAPADFIESQLKAIVGLEIEITEIKGKWKMSQNRSPEDVKGVVEGLCDSKDPHFNPELAEIVSSRVSKK